MSFSKNFTSLILKMRKRQISRLQKKEGHIQFKVLKSLRQDRSSRELFRCLQSFLGFGIRDHGLFMHQLDHGVYLFDGNLVFKSSISTSLRWDRRPKKTCHMSADSKVSFCSYHHRRQKAKVFCVNDALLFADVPSGAGHVRLQNKGCVAAMTTQQRSCAANERSFIPMNPINCMTDPSFVPLYLYELE